MVVRCHRRDAITYLHNVELSLASVQFTPLRPAIVSALAVISFDSQSTRITLVRVVHRPVELVNRDLSISSYDPIIIISADK